MQWKITQPHQLQLTTSQTLLVDMAAQRQFTLLLSKSPLTRFAVPPSLQTVTIVTTTYELIPFGLRKIVDSVFRVRQPVDGHDFTGTLTSSC